MRWDEAVDHFTTALKLARKSPNTITSYLSDLGLAIDYWGRERKRREILEDVGTLTGDDIADWVFAMHRCQHSPRTVERRQASLRLFLAYATEQGWIAASPYPESKVIQPKRSTARAEVIYLTADQVQTLMKTVEAGFPRDPLWVQQRDNALFWLLLATGMRISEACQVTRKQIKEGMARGILSIVGKGDKRRHIALPQAVHASLARYDQSRPSTTLGEYFVTQRRVPPGHVYPVTPLAPREVQRRLHRYVEKARLALPLTPHKLRHTYATALLATGVDIRMVQEALGHAHLATTEIYTHVRIDTQRSAAERLEYLSNPRQVVDNYSDKESP